MTDQLLLVPSPAFILPCVMKKSMKIIMKTIIHQTRIALYLLPTVYKHQTGAWLSPLAKFSHSNWLCILRLFYWSLRFCLLKRCLFPQRRLLCLSHAPSAPGGVTWRAFDYKKQRYIKAGREHSCCHDGALHLWPEATSFSPPTRLVLITTDRGKILLWIKSSTPVLSGVTRIT